METSPLLERQFFAQRAEVDRRDPLEFHLHHALAGSLLDRDDEPQVLVHALDLSGAHHHLRIAGEGVVAPEVLEVGVEIRLHQPAAPPAQEIGLGRLEDRPQRLLRDLRIPLQDDLPERVDRARGDGDGEHELGVGLLLGGVDPHVVMPLLLEPGLDAALGLQHQGLVEAGLAEKGEETLAAQLLLVGALDDEHDLGTDRDRISELDGVALLLPRLDRRVDPCLAVLPADEPALEPLGALVGDALAERLAGLEPELLDQLCGLEGGHGVVEGDGAHAGARATVDAVGDDGAAAYRVGLDEDADPGVEVAVALVEIPQLVDPLRHLVVGERLRAPLGDDPPQGIARESQLTGDADLRYLHHGAEDDHHDDPAPLRIVAGVELGLGRRAARLQIAQGVADPLLGQRLPHLGLDQTGEILLRGKGSVAADLDRGDQRSGVLHGLRRGRRRFLGRFLGAERHARPKGKDHGKGEPSPRHAQKRRCHWASMA